ncbi:MAG TPA: hypothetical protein VJB92_00335 [Candidatus Paceibacterota bacterium]
MTNATPAVKIRKVNPKIWWLVALFAYGLFAGAWELEKALSKKPAASASMPSMGAPAPASPTPASPAVSAPASGATTVVTSYIAIQPWETVKIFQLTGSVVCIDLVAGEWSKVAFEAPHSTRVTVLTPTPNYWWWFSTGEVISNAEIQRLRSLNSSWRSPSKVFRIKDQGGSGRAAVRTESASDFPFGNLRLGGAGPTSRPASRGGVSLSLWW